MSEIYNRFDPAKNFDRIQFRSDRILQSAEFNELQSATHHRLKGIADSLLKDGDILRDCNIIIDQDTGEATLESGALYLDGAVRGIAPAVLTIELVGTVTVGAYLVQATITEVEDPSLLNPAAGSRGYNEPGAARLQVVPEWGIAGERDDAEFYPVHTVIDGYVKQSTTPVNLDSVAQAVARYDRESTGGGSYVVDGLAVDFAGSDSDDVQTWLLDSGRAHVQGQALEFSTSRRISYTAQPETRLISSEAHLVASAGLQRIDVNRPAIASIDNIQITEERTVLITHGAFVGVSDPLPDPGVIAILAVEQGGTTFTEGDDYTLSSGAVNWSPAGAEPATGSTYSVTYRHIKSVEPIDPDATGFGIEGAVVGTLALVTYRTKLPRIDRLCLDGNGAIVWLRGVSALDNPIPPAVPATLLSLAMVQQTWLDASRRVIADSYRVVSMFDLSRYGARLDDLTRQMAEQRLRSDAGFRNSSIKSGLFVDPFLDDGLRDAGLEQSASIVAGELMLSIDAVAHAMQFDVTAPMLCTYSVAVDVSQQMRTGWMPVNAYGSQLPIPASVTLVPAIDRWTETQTVWKSPQTQHLTYGINWFYPVLKQNTTTTETVTSTAREQIQTLRQIDVAFTVNGFGPGEALTYVGFDGIAVTPAPTLYANPAGQVSGAFTIPPNVLAGSKNVVFKGSGGSVGNASFFGEGTREITSKYQLTTIREYIDDRPEDLKASRPAETCVVDPLAQTFRVTRNCQLAQIKLRGKRGSSTAPLLIHIRETSNGLPTGKVLAEQRVAATVFGVAESVATINFDLPPALHEGVEYALVVMTNDMAHELVIAELGKYDVQYGRWVSNQPYEIGVLLSSANAQTWTAHQDRDLWMSINRARYAPADRTRSVDIGSIAVTNATDLLLLGSHVSPGPGATVDYRLTLPSGMELDVASDQPVRLAAPVTGDIDITAIIRATEDMSGILLPGTTLVVGTVHGSDDYISRAVPLGADQRLTVIYDAVLPPGSSIAAEYRIDGGVWTACTSPTAVASDSGAVELTSVTTALSGSTVQVRLVLSGTPAARPRARNLRVIVSE